MTYFTATLFNILVLTALIVPGFLLKKTNLVSDRAVKDFSSVLLYVGTPFLIFSTMLSTDIYSVGWLNILLCILLSVAVHFIGIGLGFLVSIKDKEKARKNICAFSSAFSNCGFLGIPLTYVVVPEEMRGEAMLYVTLFNVVFNFLTWILGEIIFVEKEKRSRASIIKAVLNPCTIGFLLALPFVFAGLDLTKVDYVGSFISYLVGICVPVSMLVLGLRVGSMSIKAMAKNKYTYVTIALRLIVVPLITLGTAVLLKLTFGVTNAFILSLTIVAAMPTASTAIAFAEKFNADSMLAAEAVVATTLMSVVTVPLIMLLVSVI